MRAAAQAAALRLLYHISKLTLRVPLVFTKKHGIYAARLMLRLRLAFTNRTYYTMTPRSGLNKTAPAAVLHGSMFSKPCAPAQGRVPCTRAAAQAAGLRLLYHGAQSRVHGKSCARGFYFVWIFLKKGVDIGRISSYNNKALRRYAVNAMRNCVMVAPATLTRIVRVRILLPQPTGSICCRFLSGYSAVGSALRSGRRGLEFKSQYSDHSENRTRQPKTA